MAPREVQQTHKLLNTGWALATVDNKTSGLVPISYIQPAESKPFATQANPVIGVEDQPNFPMEKTVASNDEMVVEQNEKSCINKMSQNVDMQHVDPVISNDINDL